MKHLLFLLAALCLALPAQGQDPNGPHEAALSLHIVPFFLTPVPVGSQLTYTYWGDGPHGFRAGALWFARGSDGQDAGISLQYAALLGRDQHFFEPAVGLYTAYSWESVDAGGDLFRRRKWSFTPILDLMYRYQADNGWFVRGGLSGRTPPLGEVIILNDFVDDGRYDGPAVRAALLIGGGVRF